MTDLPNLSLDLFFPVRRFMKPAHYVVTREKVVETNKKEKQEEEEGKERTTCLRHVIRYQSMVFPSSSFSSPLYPEHPKQLIRKIDHQGSLFQKKRQTHSCQSIEKATKKRKKEGVIPEKVAVLYTNTFGDPLIRKMQMRVSYHVE